MPYCTQADISPAKLSTDQLKQLTSEDGASIVASVIDQAIADADSEIDSYAGRRYVVPMSPTPDRVKRLSVDIAVYNLFEKRGSTFGGEIPEVYRNMYEDAIRFLKDVSAGRADIPGATVLAASVSPTGGSFSANERVFTKEGMDKL